MISVLGLDFRTAGVDLREQVALSDDQVSGLLEILAAEKLFSEVVILSTCNRIEFYVCGGQSADHALPHLLGHLAQVKDVAPMTEMSAFYRHQGREAVRHLLRVCASLESQVVGEHEIMGQVKTAYGLACRAGTARFVLHRLFHAAFRAGKRVMTQTSLGQGTASVAQAAVDLAGRVFPDLGGKTVLLVGAGQTAQTTAQALLRSGVRRLIVANRTEYKAQQLAGDLAGWLDAQTRRGPAIGDQCPALRDLLAECTLEASPSPAGELDAQGIGLDSLPTAIDQADLVIASTGSPEPVLTHEKFHAVLAHRRRPLLMIDIAVPRDIEPRLADLPGVVLHNIDALEDTIAVNLKRRASEIPAAAAIVDEELERFEQWRASLDVVPTIQLLEQRVRAMQQAEVEKFIHNMPPQAREAMQELARSLCNKMLHDPIVFLKRLASQNGKADLSSIQTLRQMFRLDHVEQDL